MRFLIVDGHTGPSRDAAAFFTKYMHFKVEVINFYMYTDYIQTYNSLLPSVMRNKIISVLNKCNIRYHFRTCLPGARGLKLDNLNRYVDVVLCQFPGFQCTLFNDLNVKLWIRFTHRYTHHIFQGGETARKAWEKQLLRWQNERKTIFFADNEYDYMYTKYFMNITVNRWFSSVSYLQSPVSPQKQQLCWCCQRHIGNAAKKIAANIQIHFPKATILDIGQAITKNSSQSLLERTNCSHFILLPHSLHSYTSVEAYALNYPLAVPSAELLAEWHISSQIVQHKNPGNAPSMWYPYTLHEPCSNERQSLIKWFSYCDFLNWNHVNVFDRVDNILFHSTGNQSNEIHTNALFSALMLKKRIIE
jgi:hypothetical protein